MVPAAGENPTGLSVLFLSLVFPPDNVSTAHIMGELARDLQAYGHRVTALTTLPHYNDDPESQAAQPMARHWGPILKRSDYGGIPAYHIWMPRKGRSVLLRILAWMNFHVISLAMRDGILDQVCEHAFQRTRVGHYNPVAALRNRQAGPMMPQRFNSVAEAD